ncbi:MAG: M28 family peptidase [Phycisphaeraceae bacterium]|nr:M28 family peptidase [Phycisphaeraceae bacterium]
MANPASQPVDPPPTVPRPRASRPFSRAALKRLAFLFAAIGAALFCAYISMISMPGESFRGALPPATDSQRALAAELRGYVNILADAEGGVGRVGNRSTYYPRRFAAAYSWIDDQLAAYGYEQRNEYPVQRGAPVPNIEVIVPAKSRDGSGGAKPRILVIGAHYDAFQGTPGADDNASGVAATLHLARIFRHDPQPMELRFLFFVNEEPPAFWTDDMGSWVYAKACRAKNDDIAAMISIESIGYYSDAPGSQRYPQPLASLYPSTGDFIGFVGNWRSRGLTRRAISIFREHAQFPSEGAALPGIMPGVGWSDHWSFWQEGYDAIMITDTATFRNPYYHTPNDRPDTLDYDRMARVVEGIEHVIRGLAAE